MCSKKNVRRIAALLCISLLLFTGCGLALSGDLENVEVTESVKEIPASSEEQPQENVQLLLAAAASLEYALSEQIIPQFQEKYPHIKVEGTYDSSGKLQTQIEEGLHADLFFSAAIKQMQALREQGLVDDDSVVDLLENEIVLIVPAGSASAINGFEDLIAAQTVALGDPESVPAGQYAKEVLASLGMYEEIESKTSFGTNVTQVLNWVAEGSAEAGIVYATDAAVSDQVTVVAHAPEGSLEKKVLYPAGIVAGSQQKQAAQLFLDFLATPEVMAIFQEYGFTPAA